MSIANAAHCSMMGGGKRLPYDAEVEYLENVVGAYIDTGFVQSSSSLEVSLTISFPDAAKDYADYDALFGNDIRDAAGKVVFAKQQKNPFAFWRAGGTSSTGLVRVNTSEFFEASIILSSGNGYESTIKESTNTGTYTGSVVGATNPMLVFGTAHDSGSFMPTIGGYRVAHVAIKEDGVLVRDFIPVRKGTVGYLYDRVSGALFGNAGTGDFVLGPDKN